jgi:hypothetical protein
MIYFICFLISGHDCELLVWDAVQGDVSALGSLRIQPHNLRQDSIGYLRKVHKAVLRIRGRRTRRSPDFLGPLDPDP